MLTASFKLPCQPWIVTRVGCAGLKFELCTDAWSFKKILCPTVGFDRVNTRKTMSLAGLKLGSIEVSKGFKSTRCILPEESGVNSHRASLMTGRADDTKEQIYKNRAAAVNLKLTMRYKQRQQNHCTLHFRTDLWMKFIKFLVFIQIRLRGGFSGRFRWGLDEVRCKNFAIRFLAQDTRTWDYYQTRFVPW